MASDNGKIPQFTIDAEEFLGLTPRQVAVLYRGSDLPAMAPLFARLVKACSKDIGPLDNPDTYLDNLSMKEWNGLIEQMGTAVKNA